MAFDATLEELYNEQTITDMQILESLLNPTNIDMKTHIVSPITYSVLESIIDNIESLLSDINNEKLELPLTKKFLNDFKIKIKLFMVSWNRQGRTEITQTLQAVNEQNVQERSLASRLLGLGRK